MASSRTAFDDFFDDEDEDEGVVDTKADGRLLRVPLSRIAPNLVNPRRHFGTDAELEDFGRSLKRRQIQALPVVTRKAYLKLWPEHERQVGSVDVVIVSGERRYRGGLAIGLSALDCVINDDLAANRKTFMDAVVSENIDRSNFDPIEEAEAVESLVEVFGTARAVAQHYERVDGWVSQRRILLELAPALQDLVRNRAMPLEAARRLGKLVKDYGWREERQLEWWADEQQQRQANAELRRAAKKAAREAAPLTEGHSGGESSGSADPSLARRLASDPPSDLTKIESFTAVKLAAGEAEQGAHSGSVGRNANNGAGGSAHEANGSGLNARPEQAARTHRSGSDRAARPDRSEPSRLERSVSDLLGGATDGTGDGLNDSVSDTGGGLSDVVTADAMPWADPHAVVRIAKEWMTAEDFQVAAKLWQQQAESD
ncbi:hypothetical protein [Streptomyces sp. NPDC003077]|uniref:ParB/RepB/Spo0J family partition protein n=1 Tax=Streptomyces sp. NPDC003077 TaxID=3154443 RepID=UPI0033BD8D7E